MRRFSFFILIFLVGFVSNNIELQIRELNWQPDKLQDVDGDSGAPLFFDGCLYLNDPIQIPYYVESIKLKEGQNYKVEIVNKSFNEYFGSFGLVGIDFISESIQGTTTIEKSRGDNFFRIQVLPIKKTNGKLFLLKSFGIKFIPIEKVGETKSAKSWKSESVLKAGNWKKIKTAHKGIYRIPYSKLQEWGFSSPQNVNVYGNGGYMLSEDVRVNECDGLNQVSVWNGKDASGNECLFFYSSGTTRWERDLVRGGFKHLTNSYSGVSYFYLTDGVGGIKDVSTYDIINNEPGVYSNSFDEYNLHELEKYNLIRSGRQWFGEKFMNGTGHSFIISCPDKVSNSSVSINVSGVGRSSSKSKMDILINGTAESELDFDSVDTGESTSLYADEESSLFESYQNGESLNITLRYEASNSSAEAWLDYIRSNYRRNLNFTGDEMYFRDSESVGAGNIAEFTIGNIRNDLKIFDVTGIFDVYQVPITISGSRVNFKRPADELREYVIFNPETNFPEPELVGDVANQNLHSLSVPEMVVIAHPNFIETANELADFHRTNDGMAVQVINSVEVYNEFSSGMPDASGIRNFIKMLYNKAPDKLKYVLLFGDGSYDNRNVTGINKNFIPTFQSSNSLHPTGSFVSDDYYVLLDEGENVYNGAVDLGIGRIPASSVYEAQIVLNKVLNYNKPEALGSWRNVVCFIGDDEDGSLHMKDSEKLANIVNNKHGAFLTNKIYFDAFQQEATPAGERYPDVTESINNRVKDGVLILNYVGHANDRFLADEHVLDVSQINSWSNENKLPIFVTATCEFSRFDADDTSAGEYVLFNPNGGGIGLFSTTRVVYAYSNGLLSQSFYNQVFEQDENGEHYRMGDIIRLAKVNSHTGTNKRNFSLLADPALQLSYPKYKVVTSTINEKDALLDADTVKALSKITISGFISDYSGNRLSGFNGNIIPVVYDKAFMLKSIGNAEETPFEFKVQDNIIYKGLASVTNGEFTFSFIVPKDISYSLGKGKIVYYAKNSSEDAHGAFENFLIGGSTGGGLSDNTGPAVDLYLNDESFVSGDETSKNPLMLVYVSDENGINTVGTGIGHDITAVIDGDMSNILVLNDYYSANIDDYKSGKIEFPIKNLSEGEHTLTFKVWDVANNSTEVEITFFVSGQFNIEEISNYPNPVFDHTFFTFKHNQPDAIFKGLIEIFDRNGRIIDSFNKTITSNGMVSNPIRWDIGDSDSPIGNGLYLYRITIKSDEGLVTEKSGKMLLMH